MKLHPALKKTARLSLFFTGPALFFTSASLLLIACATLLVESPRDSLFNQVTHHHPAIYNAQPPILGATTQSVGTGDARGIIVEQYLASHYAPLAPYGRFIVSMADKYSLPWSLLPAIAMQESNGGKKIPSGSYNPFGWAVYGDNTKGFTSWEQAIEAVAKGLRQHYFDLGLTTPESIMPKYCPPSLAKGGSWAKGVRYFMEELEEY